jgi:translocation and assembly module TamA
MIAAMRFSLSTVVILTAVALCGAPRAFAADPQPYRVEMASTGDSALDATLKATSELLSLRSSAPVSPFGLIARARSDIDRLKTVLESFGYYQGSVTITIDGRPLDDPSLGEALSALPKDTEAVVRISFNLGPLYHLRRINIDGDVPKSAADALGLTPGAPAVAADVLAAGDRLLTALQDQGYAFAKVDRPTAQEDPANHVLDVSFHVVAGPRVQIGEIRFDGLQHVHEKLVRRRLLVHTGEQYSASKVEQARKDLLGLGVFAAVSVKLGTQADGSGRVPITFQMRERPRHAVSLNAAYSSDLGGSGGVTWTHRNVFGNAEQLTIAASAIDLGGSSTTGAGYDTSIRYLTPEFGHRDQSLQLAVGAIKQSLLAYAQTARTAGVTLNRKISSIWSGSIGLTAENESILQEASLTDNTRVRRDYSLLAFPLSILYNSTNLVSPLDDPRHGVRASFNVAPTLSQGPPNATFIISQANVAVYFDLQQLRLTHDPGRSVLAMRALAGLAQGAGQFSLPPDQRFYAGGSGTVRGYRYQSVGPQFLDGNPVGGTAISAGSIEFRQRIGTSYGAAVFVDGGQVSAKLQPLTGTIRFGAGAGVRYYTPIGPIRLDLALPINRRSGDDAFEIYIGLGQAF